MNEGTQNRTVASTNMNKTSSRAHTVVTLKFTQKGKSASGANTTKTSNVNLVDLAGRFTDCISCCRHMICSRVV